MKAGPFKFLASYRNPCWETATKELPPIKCLPYFYLLGAPKSGTTDLHARIYGHPSVTGAGKGNSNWLPRSHYGNLPLLENYISVFRNAANNIYMDKDEKDWHSKVVGNLPLLENYISVFRNAANNIYMDKDEKDWHSKVVGDCSTSTLWDNDYWTMLPEFDNLTEPLYTNADYIYHLNPKTKLIAILRNPIDRMYSDYLYFGGLNKSPQQFHDVVVKDIDYMTQCLKYRSERFCAYHKANDCTKVKRFRIGMYSVHLKEFLRVFPRSQIHVLYLEESTKNISMAMEKLFKFLELEPVNAVQMKSICFKEHKNERSTAKKAIGDMLPKTRELLSKFYHPYNQELSQLLGHSFNYNK